MPDGDCCRFGLILGFQMRQQAIATVHSKLVRLSAPAVASLSPGFIINLVSSDVRRFEDGGCY